MGHPRHPFHSIHRIVLVVSQFTRGMMRHLDVDDVFHECAAVTRVTIPVVGKEVTTGESVRKLVSVEHGQTMAHPMNALKPDPSVCGTLAKWFAERVGFTRADAVESREIRLNYPVIAARLKRFGALGEGGSDIAASLPGGDSDCMREHVSVASNAFVHFADFVQRSHRHPYFSSRRDRHQVSLIAADSLNDRGACLPDSLRCAN